MRFTKIATTALAAAMALTVGAIPAMAGTPTFEEHRLLVDRLDDAGIAVVINQRIVCQRDIDGAYFGQLESIVICQDNGVAGGPEVDWTSNDLDTLRHETQHLIQDCMDGAGNTSLVPMFDSEQEVLDFVARSPLTQGQVGNIIKNYAERGLDREGIILELEAFAVASSISPTQLAEAVTTYCPAN